MAERFSTTVRYGLGVLFAVTALIFLTPVWFMAGHGASISTFDQIRPGMNQNDVIRLLGRPNTINDQSSGGHSWYYTRCTFCMVVVHLDKHGLVKETVHDH
jgi:outer membrane protein assembly factor BamE (lipoprotein component of BamABCDE complex)